MNIQLGHTDPDFQNNALTYKKLMKVWKNACLLLKKIRKYSPVKWG